MNGGWGISYEIALRWMPLDLTDEKSTLVQVMAWCRQATSHYLSQCWPRSMSPNGVTRPQWVKNLNSSPSGQNGRHFAGDIFRCILLMKNFVFWLKFHLSLFLRIQLTINPALVQILAWCQIGDKPWSEPMLIRFTDAHMWYNGEMS